LILPESISATFWRLNDSLNVRIILVLSITGLV
jgi:hypothetical protein